MFEQSCAIKCRQGKIYLGVVLKFMNVKLTIVAVVLLFAQNLSAQPSSSNPFSRLNSAFDELNPVLSPDGNQMFFTIANHPANMGGRRDPGDIWFCSREGNAWSQPVHGGNLLNNSAFNGVAGFSPDGRELYLLSHYDNSGQPARTQGIAVARRRGNGWSQPENIAIPYYQNKSNIVSGYLTADLAYFVFSAETYGSYGVEDLYVCERKPDGKWSQPRNLGSGINTQFQEITPSLSTDGKTLYFSTNGRKGAGSFDVFAATRLNDDWTSWSEPVNLEGINTEGRDLYYREYPNAGYSIFTSTKNSDGYGDLRMHTPENPFTPDSTLLARSDEASPVVRETIPADDKHSVQIYGKVFNARSGESIPAVITFEPQGNPNGSPTVVRADQSGYAVDINTIAQYKLRIEASGFISTLEKLDVQTFEMKDLEMNFQLQPIEVGTTVNLKDVLFEQSKTILLPESFAELDLVVSFLKTNPSVRIELSGHTDNRGIPAQNVKLSQGRVDRVKEYLISKGIDKKRISGKGYGGNKPIASNDSEETRKLNRRVEFTIKKN